MEDERPARGDLWIEDRRIAAVTPADPAPDWRTEEVERRDVSSFWILPGFVQTHVHLCQTLFRGLGEGRELYRWLSEVIWPLEAALEPDTLRVSAEAGIYQLLASGTTAILDMGTTRHTSAIAEAVEARGLRAFLGPAIMDRGPAQALVRAGGEFRREVEELASVWEGHDDGRIRLALCPRFVPSVSDPLFRELAREPSFRSFPIHTHGSETRQEVEEVRSLTGTTPPAYLASLDGGRGRVKMAHGVWLSAEDRAALRECGGAVLHCPGSNLKLGSGLADLRALREAGVPVGLGADGAACNNRLDAWREMRLAGSIASTLHGPSTLSAFELLRLATLDGAKVLGLEDEIGSLKRSKRADLTLIDPTGDEAALGAEGMEGMERTEATGGTGATSGLAEEPPEALLVYAGSSRMVRETWVDGRVVFDRASARPERRELSARFLAARRRVLERAGFPVPG
jgi:cytosine/adenosine deaminase-related metal-dependent hydrolase